MPCEQGKTLHSEFANAVKTRLEQERTSHLDLYGNIKLAKKQEDVATLNRAMHVARCIECWNNPPR